MHSTLRPLGRNMARKTVLATALAAFIPAAFAAPGDPLAPPFVVDPGNLSQGQIVKRDAVGDILVVWAGSYPAIRARLFNAAGSPRGPAFSVGSGSLSSVAMNAGGAFVVSYTNTAADGNAHTYVQRYNSSGAANGAAVDALPHGSDGVAMDDDGDFVLVWDGSKEIRIPDGLGSYGVLELGDSTVTAQRFNANGSAKGLNIPVNFSVTNPTPLNGVLNPSNPAVAMDGAGDFIVAWNDNSLALQPSVYARRYSKNGLPQGLGFRVGPGMPADGGGPAIAMAQDGSFAISWSTLHVERNSLLPNNRSYSGSDLQLQRYSKLGLPSGKPVAVSDSSDVVTGGHSVAMDQAGNLTLAWTGTTSGCGCIPYYQFLRRIPASGSPAAAIMLSTDQGRGDPSLAADAGGGLALSWSEVGNVYLQLLSGQ